MSPTILREGPYRFYFNSNEEPRMHVHVEASDGRAKFWLEPFPALAFFRGFRQHELNQIQKLVEQHEKEFINAWKQHFPD